MNNVTKHLNQNFNSQNPINTSSCFFFSFSKNHKDKKQINFQPKQKRSQFATLISFEKVV